MPRHTVSWLTNLGLPLAMLFLAWGCGGTATLLEPATIAKASPAPRKTRPAKSPVPTPRPTPSRPPIRR